MCPRGSTLVRPARAGQGARGPVRLDGRARRRPGGLAARARRLRRDESERTLVVPARGEARHAGAGGTATRLPDAARARRARPVLPPSFLLVDGVQNKRRLERSLAAAADVRLAAVSAYDPEGGDGEHPEAVSRRPTATRRTYWTTERYTRLHQVGGRDRGRVTAGRRVSTSSRSRPTRPASRPRSARATARAAASSTSRTSRPSRARPPSTWTRRTRPIATTSSG